jgi:hypothetical protein
MTLYIYRYNFDKKEYMPVESTYVGSVHEGKHTYVAYEDFFGAVRYIIAVDGSMLTPEMVGEFILAENKKIGQMYSWKDDETSKANFVNYIVDHCNEMIQFYDDLSEKYKLIKEEIQVKQD